MSRRTVRTRILFDVLLSSSLALTHCSKNSGGQPGSSGKPGAAGSSMLEGGPIEVPNPDLADACAMQGKRTGIVNGVCPGYAGSWDESAALAPTTPEQSSLPACPMAEDRDLAGLSAAGWRLRVERDLGVFPAGESADRAKKSLLAPAP